MLKKIIVFLRIWLVSSTVFNFDQPLFLKRKRYKWNKLWLVTFMWPFICFFTFIVGWCAIGNIDESMWFVLYAAIISLFVAITIVSAPNMWRLIRIIAACAIVVAGILVFLGFMYASNPIPEYLHEYLQGAFESSLMPVGFIVVITQLTLSSRNVAYVGHRTDILSYRTFTDREHIQVFSNEFYDALDSKIENSKTLDIRPVVGYRK